MRRMTQAAVLVTAMLCSGPATAWAGQILETPAGLHSGDKFRFVFITDGATTAISSNIATYNNFVNSQAGGATYDGSVVQWFAIGSTRSESAINNVGQTETPVYLADGTLVTSSTTSTGLWSGSLLNPVDEDLSDRLITHQGTWTGTGTNGSVYYQSPIYPAGPLGDFLGVVIGNSSATGGGWVNDGVWPSESTFGVFHIFGISQVLTAVPEPSSLWLAVIGGLGVSARCWSRKRRVQPPSRP